MSPWVEEGHKYNADENLEYIVNNLQILGRMLANA